MIFRNPTSLIELTQVFEIIRPISNFYPNFNDWYFDKVIPGVILGQDKVIIAEQKNRLVGVSIIKDGPEKKLRALRISDEFQGKGYGLYLIDESLKQLNFDKPTVTVAEEMLHNYSRLFIERYDFSLDRVHKGIYRKGKLEYSFNEFQPLSEKSVYF